LLVYAQRFHTETEAKMVNPHVAYLGFPHPETVSAASAPVNGVAQNDPGERDPARVRSRAADQARVGAPRRSLHEAAHKLSRPR
jgi:hypothetical protein